MVQNHIATAALLGLIAVLPAATQAQTATPSVAASATSRIEPTVEVPANQGDAPLFTLFGFQARIAAPVAAPYAGSAYVTFGGQPERGGDSVLAQAAR